MYIRSASSPSTVLWAFRTIQPSSLAVQLPRKVNNEDVSSRSFSAHRTQKATCKNTQLLTQHDPLYLQLHLFRPGLISLQILLLSYSSISLYPPLSVVSPFTSILKRSLPSSTLQPMRYFHIANMLLILLNYICLSHLLYLC